MTDKAFENEASGTLVAGGGTRAAQNRRNEASRDRPTA